MNSLLGTILKIAVSLAALWLVFKLGWGLAELPDTLSVEPIWLAANVGVNALILALLTVRFHLLARAVPGQAQPTYGWCLRANWMGLGAAQVAFGALSSDALRVAALTRTGFGLGPAVSLIMADRIIGLSALLLMGLAAVAMIVEDAWVLVPVLAGLVIVAPWVLRLLARLRLGRLGDVVRVLADIANTPRAWLALPLSVATHMLSVVAFYAAGRGFGLVPPMPETAVAVPAGLIGAALPISFGGWGTREFGVAGAYRLLETPFDEAVLVSVLYALGILAFALPGLLFSFSLLKRQATDDAAKSAS